MSAPRRSPSLPQWLQGERTRDEDTARRVGGSSAVGPQRRGSSGDGIPQGGPLTENFEGGPYDFTLGSLDNGGNSFKTVGGFTGGQDVVFSEMWASSSIALQANYVEDTASNEYADATSDANFIGPTEPRARHIASTTDHQTAIIADDNQGFSGLLLTTSTGDPSVPSNTNTVHIYFVNNGGTIELRAMHNEVDVVIASW